MFENEHSHDNIIDTPRLPFERFLGCPTPIEWCKKAASSIDILLIDHKNCEYKAASNAMHLMAKYSCHEPLIGALSRLAREELVHYEQVLKLIKSHKIALKPLSSGRYAARLRDNISPTHPTQLIDILLISAFIEARSAERFHTLAPYLEQDLKRYYLKLLSSEARHFEIYIRLAKLYGDTSYVEHKILELREIEKQLILTPDPCFRFHSGPPVQ